MSGVSSPPQNDILIDVEFVEMPELGPDLRDPVRGTGALVSRGVTNPVAVVVQRQDLVRERDRERKRVARSKQRDLQQRSKRRRAVLRRLLPGGVLVAVLGGLVMVPAVSGVPTGRLDALVLQQLGLSAAVGEVASRIDALPDPTARLDGVATRLDGVAAGTLVIDQRTGAIDRRLGPRPAQTDDVTRGTSATLAAVVAVGERVDGLNRKLDTLNTLVAAAPTRLTPAPADAASNRGGAAPGALPPMSGAAAGAWPDLATCRGNEPVVTTWTAVRGEWLSDTIFRWAREACWQRPDWRVPGDYPWQADAIFENITFKEALRGALRAFEQAVPRPLGESSDDNRALTIYPAIDDRGG